MFLQYFGHVPRPLEEVEGMLPDLLEHLGAWAEGSYREGEALRMRMGTDRRLMAKTVRLSIGTSRRSESSVRIALSWEATGTPGLFPRMEADLVLARLDGGMTQVKLEGNYEPPLGSVGRLLDNAVFHRIAESSVKKLVDQIIEALSSGPSGSNGPDSPAPSTPEGEAEAAGT